MKEEANQANAACPHFDADQMKGNHESVSERQSGTTLKEVGDVGTHIKGVVPPTPCLKSRSGNLELFGSLTLGNALSS